MASAISANRLELLQIADAVAREKLIDKGIVIEAMEDAIQRAARARYGAENDIRAKLDPNTGDLRLMPCPVGEVRGARQRPVDAGRRDFDFVIACDGVFGLDEIEQCMGKLGAAFHIHAAVGPFGHDLQGLGRAAHDAQAHQLEPRLFNDGFEHRFQMRCGGENERLQKQSHRPNARIGANKKSFPAATLRPPHNRSCC